MVGVVSINANRDWRRGSDDPGKWARAVCSTPGAAVGGDSRAVGLRSMPATLRRAQRQFRERGQASVSRSSPLRRDAFNNRSGVERARAEQRGHGHVGLLCQSLEGGKLAVVYANLDDLGSKCHVRNVHHTTGVGQS
jgi:hypothetical protein